MNIISPPHKDAPTLTERIKRLVLMSFILVSVPVYAYASSLTGIPIPQGNVVQQLVKGVSYTVTCTGGGVYFRGWTGSGGGSNLQNNCGSGFTQNLNPAIYQFSVQDSSGFNTIETFNVEVVLANYCQNGATDYPTCSPPVTGCMDSRAINYVASSTVNTTCTYPFKSFDAPFQENIFRYGATSSLITTPNISGFSYATETFSGTPYLYTTGGVHTVNVSLRYPLNTPIRTLYIVGTHGFRSANYTRLCDSTYRGGGTEGMVGVGSPFRTPDDVLVSVYKITIPFDAGNCVQFAGIGQGIAAPAGMRVYSMWASSDENVGVTSLTEATGIIATTASNQTYIASSTLPNCGLTDISCYTANAFSYVFTPNPSSITRFKSLTLASSAPFSYAYDVGNLRNEFYNTASTSQLGLTVTTGIGDITFINRAMVENVPYASFIRTLIGWLLWIMFASLVYRQILQVHNKEHTT